MPLKTKKTPKAHGTPSETKIPKAFIPNENSCLVFREDQMDTDGSWGWKNISPLQLQDIFSKIFSSQKLTWQDLKANRSHLVKIKDFCPEAKKRLFQIKKDDIDQLYSLRLSGKERIWGIKDGNIFWLLWWDPNHEVCHSNKK